VALGGDLEQHMVEPHRHVVHTVAVDPGTLLGDVVGLTVQASCYHHQRADVLGAAIDHAREGMEGSPLIYLSPRGRPLTQPRVRELSPGPGAILLAGRFEGVDQRVIDARGLEEISIGDYVLSGGELAAMVLIDACVRLLPGVLGADASLTEESFENGLLEYPQYTRPRAWEGRTIPDILLSGDHKRIAAWRRAEAERLTRERRPDLIARAAQEGAKSEGSK